MNHKKAKKKAKKIAPEDREAKAFEYLDKAAKNQEKAARELDGAIKGTNEVFKSIIENTDPLDQAKVQQTVQDVNRLLAEAKNGGNINDIVKNLKALK